MNKIFFLLIISFVIVPLCLYADDDDDIAWTHVDDNPPKKKEVEVVEITIKEKKERGPILGKKRKVEVGLLNMDAGVGNNFLTFSQVFKEKLFLDFDKLSKGLKMNLNVAVSPLYFNYNKDNIWGFGISTKAEAIGLIGISGKMLSFTEAEKEKSDLGGAAFAEVGFPGFFHYKKFKIKAKPALYYPFAYAKSNIDYLYKNSDTAGGAETRFKVDFDFNVYTIGQFGTDKDFEITAKPGFDICMGVEFPLSEALGLQDKFYFLNFDVGVDIVNLPIAPSTMYDYLHMTGSVGSNDPLTLDENTDWKSLYSFDGNLAYDKKRQYVLRPFKMVTWAEWRPFGNNFIAFIPSIGFAVNLLYAKPVSVEGGIKARLDLLKFFIVTAGTVYEDRMWKNSIALALDLRIFEFDLGVDLRSPSFAKSWSGGGAGVQLGFKFGW